MSSNADFKQRFNSVFLLTQQEEKNLPTLIEKINSALQGMKKGADSGIDFANRLMNRETVREAFLTAGIDIEGEFAKIQKRAAHPSFTLIWDAEAPIEDRKRMILFTSTEPTTAVYLPNNYKGIYTLYDGFLSAKTRGEKSKFILKIRDLLFASGKIPDGSRFLAYNLWSGFFSYGAILCNVSITSDISTKLPGIYSLDSDSLSFSGVVSNTIHALRTKGIVDTMADPPTVRVGDFVVTSKNAEKIGVGESKLLRLAIAAFTRINAQHEKNPRLAIYADTKDFARRCGKDVDPANMESPTLQAKENKRAAKAIENFIAKLNRNAMNLQAPFTWQEKAGKKTTSYNGVVLISEFHIDEDVIHIEFTPKAAEYLVTLPLTQEPIGLYAIDDRNNNAFSIAVQMNLHYSIENNVIRNTENILSVTNLLGYTSLPSYEEVKKQETSWWARIKEPFEKALDELTRSGFLSNWHYCHAGKIALTDREVDALKRYEQFASLYVCFELAGYSTHEERAVTIQKKRDEGRAKNTPKIAPKNKQKPKRDKGKKE